MTFVCLYERCQSCFRTEDSMIAHMKSKSAHPRCEQCNWSSSLANTKYLDHLARCHTYCVACRILFDNATDLKSHYRHSGKHISICTECNLQFRTFNAFSAHRMRAHTYQSLSTGHAFSAGSFVFVGGTDDSEPSEFRSEESVSIINTSTVSSTPKINVASAKLRPGNGSVTAPAATAQLTPSSESPPQLEGPGRMGDISITAQPVLDHIPSIRYHEGFHSETSKFVVFMVEDTLFRLDSYFLFRDSAHFRKLMAEELCTEASPCTLANIKATEFERFLSVLYPTDFDRHDASTAEEWLSVYALASAWSFNSIERLASRELGCLPGVTLMDKIILGDRYRFQLWSDEGYLGICMRPAPLTLEEGQLLGMERVIEISRLRECARMGWPFAQSYGIFLACQRDVR